MCTASQFSFLVGALLVLFAISVPFYGATIRKQAEVDLEDIRRQASLGGAKALLFKLGYPLVWFIYLPINGFFKALYLAIVLMLLPLVFC
jgi:hypothetical protein